MFKIRMIKNGLYLINISMIIVRVTIICMFTGIIKEIGKVEAINQNGENKSFEISCKTLADDLAEGDSVNINGICSTIVRINGNSFVVDYMPETLKLTDAGSWNIQDYVNLEPALKLNDKLSGHFVMGHVDETGVIEKITDNIDSKEITIKFPKRLTKYIALKGSITVDGISLTVSFLEYDTFNVSLIPHTIANTTLGSKNIKDTVNIEIDMLSRYLQRLFDERDNESSYEFLRERGFI